MHRIQLHAIPDPELTLDPYMDLEEKEKIVKATTVHYGQLIRQVVRQPLDRRNGADITEMRLGVRILDALDAAEANGKVLRLEDADYDHLKAKVEHFPYGAIDRRFLQFIDDVLNAPKVDS